MTLQEAKSIVRHLGLTLRKVRSGDYCVKLRDGNEAPPYYTDDLMTPSMPRFRSPEKPKPRHSPAATNKRFAPRTKSPHAGKATSRVRRCCCRGNATQRDRNM